MSRRRYIQIDGVLHEVDRYTTVEPRSAMVMDDIDPFMSPIDHRPVYSRSSLREHNLVHQVTDSRDYKEEWERAAKKRADLANGVQSDRKLEEKIREQVTMHVDASEKMQKALLKYRYKDHNV